MTPGESHQLISNPLHCLHLQIASQMRPFFERERRIIKRKKKNTIGEKREADEEHMLTEMTQRREEGLPAT